jgi:hypothetical protein
MVPFFPAVESDIIFIYWVNEYFRPSLTELALEGIMHRANS